MRYSEFQTIMKPYQFFNTQLLESLVPTLEPRRLSEWKQKGYLINIIRWWWCFADRPRDLLWLYKLSQHLHSPAYISLQSALKYYNLIPETVFSITSVSTKKTIHYTTPIWSFIYQTIKPSLYQWYTIINSPYGDICMATPAKAICDLLYLNPTYQHHDDFEGLRINIEKLKHISSPWDFETYSKLYNQATQHRIQHFISYMKNSHA
jgi:predicted transcriptional regulator of viral defense system